MRVPLLSYRPRGRWPGEPTRLDERVRGPFRASYADTTAALRHELAMLDARGAAIEVDLLESEIRRDGLPYARAHPRSPGVVLSFECRWGPMRLACDRFEDWRANLRAIVLGLEALRKVDRYGIARSGEQYRGWLALESGERVDERRGFDLIERHGGVRAALKATHPDLAGHAADFAAVQAARMAMAREAARA